MSFFKAIGRLFEEEKNEQSSSVRSKPIDKAKPLDRVIQIDRSRQNALDNKRNNSGAKFPKTKINEALVDELKMCRVRIARREGIRPYMVFTDWQLSAIIEAKPISERELSWIEGFDEEKASKYGKEISKIFRYR